ncbi:hypothetical protein [Micromonospora cathayae]|uniref:LexA-binding, inner membrane-associated hydrolase n=1 Tax=Micromonospora cathayae TaxID=3028804 RepID=A0ABY7ZJI5_9ACTN|nr:hypothetical protein [Micromonospora sp. HUAS 3]WDZ83042.1 hypothetical protein PVK37_21560 [Micromonospora sp. HUAS 3]
MTDTTLVRNPPTDRRRLLRHVLEMLAAMVAGMLLLDPLWTVAADRLGRSDVLARPGVGALVMAVDMAVGMTVWMRYRGHPWTGVAEMNAAMAVPLVLLVVPWWAGLIDADALTLGAHLLMVPAMVAVAWRRRDADVRHDAPAGRLGTLLRKRWPTLLAVLVTADLWFAPTVPDPWFLLVLPAGYLLIGAYRRQFADRRVLAAQLAHAVGWTALAAVAAHVADPLATVLVAAGWLAHAAWDGWHHRRDRVVPRGYAEWCIVFDIAVGVTVLLTLL